MGQNTDAILAFGVAYDEDTEFPWSDLEDGYDEWVDRLAGVPVWGTKGYSYEARVEALGAFDCPIELVHHCYSEYPMYIIAVKGTYTRAYRGQPKTVNHWLIDAAKVERAKALCDYHGIKWADPAWLLASDWGH